MQELLTTENLVALLSLTLLELVLGIDNVVFLAILVGKLPKSQQKTARVTGLGLAVLMRLALLFTISWLMGLTRPWFTVLEKSFSGKDLILLAGGVFLVGKATFEIYHKLEAEYEAADGPRGRAFAMTVVTIVLLDIVFSLDSVITAVGMARHIAIMATAVVLAVGVMLVFSGPITDFVNQHPSLKMLALAFLLLIGVMLVADGMGHHIPKGYIYSAMAFSLLVEMLNMRMRRRHKPVALHEPDTMRRPAPTA